MASGDNAIKQRQAMAQGSTSQGYGTAAATGSSLKRFAKGGSVKGMKGMDGALGHASGVHKGNGHKGGYGGVKASAGSSGKMSGGTKGPSKTQFPGGTVGGGSLRQKW